MIGLYILLIGALLFVFVIGGIAIHQSRHKTTK